MKDRTVFNKNYISTEIQLPIRVSTPNYAVSARLVSGGRLIKGVAKSLETLQIFK